MRSVKGIPNGSLVGRSKRGLKRAVKRGKADPHKLTDQEEVFVRQLLLSGEYDPKEAAIKAGYKNPQTAARTLLRKDSVVRALVSLRNQRNEKMEFQAEDLLKELGYVALRDPLDLCDENGQIIVNNLSQVPKRMRACIDGIKVSQRSNPLTGEVTQQMELKLAPKMHAIELAMKHFGMLEQKQEVTHKLQVDWEKLYQDGSVAMKAVEPPKLGLSEVIDVEAVPVQ